MAETETTETTTTEEGKEAEGKETEDQRVPYERFQQANKKAKDASDKAAQLEKDLAKLRTEIEERDEKGLPELDQLKKRLEAAEKRAAEAETEAEKSKTDASNARKERWVLAAATNAKFVDADDAMRYVDLSEIDDKDAAERAVKAVAKSKKHLIQDEDKPLPGKVLKDGQRTENGKAESNIDLTEEAQALAEGLKQFASSS